MELKIPGAAAGCAERCFTCERFRLFYCKCGKVYEATEYGLCGVNGAIVCADNACAMWRERAYPRDVPPVLM